MTSLLVILGWASPIKNPGYVYARGKEGGVWGCAPPPPKSLLVFPKRELTSLLAQEDQQTVAQKQLTTSAFL